MANGTNHKDHVYHSTLVASMDNAHNDRMIADLYLKGKTQKDIGDMLGLNHSTVSKRMKTIMAEWRESAIRDFDEARQIELQRLLKMKDEMWEAWERSKGDAETETEEFSQAGIKTTRKREKQVGDPRYMTLALQCLTKRCSLLGLDQNITKLEIRTWEDRVIDFLKDGRITPVQLIDEIGENAARPLLNRANMGTVIIQQ